MSNVNIELGSLNGTPFARREEVTASCEGRVLHSVHWYFDSFEVDGEKIHGGLAGSYVFAYYHTYGNHLAGDITVRFGLTIDFESQTCDPLHGMRELADFVEDFVNGEK